MNARDDSFSERGMHMAARTVLSEQGPKLENEVLTETVRRLPKQGVWTCGARRFSLGSGKEPGAVILAAVNERRERLLTLSTADGGGYEDLLQGFAEALAERGEAPEILRTEDELSERILAGFCKCTGIALRRKTGRKLFRDAVWLSEHPETGEKGAEKDPFFLILMQLRDEEFARMPQDLAERLQRMSERGLAPKKLAERIRTLSQK